MNGFTKHRRLVPLTNKLNPRLTHIIINILSSNMQKRPTKIAITHLQSIIQTPKGGSKTITNTREPTATCGVGLEHQKRLVVCKGGGGSAEEGGDEILAGSVVKVFREFVLDYFG